MAAGAAAARAAVRAVARVAGLEVGWAAATEEGARAAAGSAVAGVATATTLGGGGPGGGGLGGGGGGAKKPSDCTRTPSTPSIMPVGMLSTVSSDLESSWLSCVLSVATPTVGMMVCTCTTTLADETLKCVPGLLGVHGPKEEACELRLEVVRVEGVTSPAIVKVASRVGLYSPPGVSGGGGRRRRGRRRRRRRHRRGRGGPG